MANILEIKGQTIAPRFIKSIEIAASYAGVGETLSADTITCVLNTGERITEGFATAGFPNEVMIAKTEPFHVLDGAGALDVSSYTVGDIIQCYADGVLLGKYYVRRIEQTGTKSYKITGETVAANLANEYHFGGIYDFYSSYTLMSDILAGYSFFIDATFKNVTVSGYLPYASKRDNLQQVLFATGAQAVERPDGKIYILPLNNSTTGDFGTDRCYIGGSVKNNTVPDAVQITEHTFYPLDEEELVYSDSVLGEQFVRLSEPHYDYSIDNGSILRSGANFVAFEANGAVNITGKKYQHITGVATVGDEESSNVLSITDATLVNPTVSGAIAKRVLDYRRNSVEIVQDVLTDSEMAGDYVQVVNPWTREKSGALITDMKYNLSAVNKARVTFLVGTLPEGTISGYTNYVLLTGSGTWTAPSIVGDTIRVILIGGGNGGDGAGYGQDGGEYKRSSIDTKSEVNGCAGGAGGAAGAGGASGKVFEITLSVKKNESYTFTCGTGGAGGKKAVSAEAKPTAGGIGTASTFEDFTSANGREYPNGYFEAKTGAWYGKKGTAGKAGGKGGNGGKAPHAGSDQTTEPKAENGGNVGSYKGGAGGANAFHMLYYSGSGRGTARGAGGGGGGGASANAAGTNGADGVANVGNIMNTEIIGANGGNGAAGSNGASATVYGCGGNGGNGGGGGGGGGGAYRYDNAVTSPSGGRVSTGISGKGAAGGDGGKGANGCIIIYY